MLIDRRGANNKKESKYNYEVAKHCKRIVNNADGEITG